MTQEKYYATGKRKTSVARVWLQPGEGKILVNNLDTAEYFGGGFALRQIEKPFMVTDLLGRYNVIAMVRGGGKVAQANAICHGISKALLDVDVELRPSMKKAGLLTRDSRVKERKKYGQKGARARFQYSKR